MSEESRHSYQNHSSQDLFSEGVDIFTLFIILWRRKFIILAALLLGVMGALFLIASTPPRYTAHSHILVNSELSSLSPEQILLSKKASVLDIGSILTEIEVLKSRRLAGRVVKRLNLVDDTDFQNKPKKQPAFFSSKTGSSYGFRDFSVDGTALKTLPPEAVDPKVSETVTHFLESLKVSSVPGSLAVKVSFTSHNPQKAALITNIIVDEYIQLKLSQKRELQQRVTQWLDNRLKKLRKHLLKIETDIEEYKARYNIVPGSQDVISTRQILDLNGQYAQVREEYSKLQSQLDQLSQKDEGNILATINSKIVNTTLIRELESDKIRLETRVAELSNRYGPKHPEMIKARSELADTQNAIQVEFEKAKEILRTELNVSKKRIKEIERDLSSEKTEEIQDSEALVHLKGLEREAEASRLVLKTFLESYRRSLGKNELQDSDVDIISHASVPTQESYPNRMLIFALSIFVSLMMGMFFAIIAEKLSSLKKQQARHEG